MTLGAAACPPEAGCPTADRRPLVTGAWASATPSTRTWSRTVNRELRPSAFQKMNLEILPTRIGGAAENMATDFLLLQRYPRAGTPWFRHYGWHRPAFTFGYSQKISFVREQLSSFADPPSPSLRRARPPAS